MRKSQASFKIKGVKLKIDKGRYFPNLPEEKSNKIEPKLKTSHNFLTKRVLLTKLSSLMQNSILSKFNILSDRDLKTSIRKQGHFLPGPITSQVYSSFSDIELKKKQEKLPNNIIFYKRSAPIKKANIKSNLVSLQLSVISVSKLPNISRKSKSPFRKNIDKSTISLKSLRMVQLKNLEISSFSFSITFNNFSETSEQRIIKIALNNPTFWLKHEELWNCLSLEEPWIAESLEKYLVPKDISGILFAILIKIKKVPFDSILYFSVPLSFEDEFLVKKAKRLVLSRWNEKTMKRIFYNGALKNRENIQNMVDAIEVVSAKVQEQTESLLSK